jgi:formate dehydrogenase major subunit
VTPDGQDSKIIHVDTFKRGKGAFQYHDFAESQEIEMYSEEYPYILTTNRELEHYNCGTMTRRTKNVEILTEDVLLIHPYDAEENGIVDGDMVSMESARGQIEVKARVSEDIKPGILSSTFHFPEIMMNMITSNESDSEALCPEYKVVAVRIRKSEPAMSEV